VAKAQNPSRLHQILASTEKILANAGPFAEHEGMERILPFQSLRRAYAVSESLKGRVPG
jgi:hypothetical protein